MKRPKITVLMPVYNGQKYLNEAIQSILDQTYTDFELLIINDASTDKSEQVIRSFSDSRIRLVTNKTNLNLLNTLNLGLQMASGNYIARMDQDDICLKSRLAMQCEYLDNNPDIGIVGSGFQIIDQNGLKGPVIRFPGSPKVLKWSLCFYSPLAHPTVMMRKPLITKLGGYTSPDLPERGNHPSEDYDLWRRASQVTHLSNIPQVLLYLRKHESNLTTTHMDEHLTDAHKISRLAISNIVHENVTQDVVTMLWSKRYKTTSHVPMVSDLIIRLYKTYRHDNSLSLIETQTIRFDAVKRILTVALQPAARIIRYRIIAQAFTIGLCTSVVLLMLLLARSVLFRNETP